MWENTNIGSMTGGSEMNGELMIVAIVVLSCVLLFTLGLHLYAKWFWRRSGSVSHDGSWSSSPSRLNAQGGEVNETGGNIMQGLEKAVMESLPLFVYRASDGHGLDCAVCLSGFAENEKGRILPKCNHVFHVECIEMWFYSHCTCPLCRTKVDVEVDVGIVDEVSAPSSSHANHELDLGEGEGEGEVGHTDSAKVSMASICSLRRLLSRENSKIFPSSYGVVDNEEGGAQDCV